MNLKKTEEKLWMRRPAGNLSDSTLVLPYPILLSFLRFRDEKAIATLPGDPKAWRQDDDAEQRGQAAQEREGEHKEGSGTDG